MKRATSPAQAARCFDIGNQTRRALELFKSGTPLPEARDLLAGSGSGAGNGALMRLAPIVIKYHNDLRTALAAAAFNAQLTHPDTRCVHANQVFAFLMLKAMGTDSKRKLLDIDAIRFAIPGLSTRRSKR
jgi:ADP-ribosyl-[dinitrogen reductase] hydrolase